jgi:uncharacterized protein (TIGR03435 family)
MLRRVCIVGVLVCGAALGMGVSAQEPGAALTFDVAAIKPSQPGATGGVVKPLPNGTGYMVQNMTVKTMMSVMYRIPGKQIAGGPGWFDSEPFDVEARADHAYSMDDLHTMFKNLLVERFGLKFHIEDKEGPVYWLTVAKGGLKMKPDGDVGDLKIPITPTGNTSFVGVKVPIPYLCYFLGQQGNDTRPVIDKTGLTGVYDFKLEFLPRLPPGVSVDDLPPQLQSRPVFEDAVEDQLGLKLMPEKGPVPQYVIDHIDPPTAN